MSQWASSVCCPDRQGYECAARATEVPPIPTLALDSGPARGSRARSIAAHLAIDKKLPPRSHAPISSRAVRPLPFCPRAALKTGCGEDGRRRRRTTRVRRIEPQKFHIAHRFHHVSFRYQTPAEVSLASLESVAALDTMQDKDGAACHYLLCGTRATCSTGRPFGRGKRKL